MRISFLFLVVSVFAACSSSKQANNDFAKFGFMDGIYSTRPQGHDPFITILKLKNPALLESAERKEGKLVLDQALLKAIQEEQASTIAELQRISPDIHILLRYKLVLNGLTILAPEETLERITNLPNVILVEKSLGFARPRLEESEDPIATVGERTSVQFIGAEAAYAQNIHGEGMRVGVIDTGIDYTHKMFQGAGTKEAYKANEPGKPSADFPNKKVVGGVDLVGTEYNAASPLFSKKVPVPDANPLDEAGHGTHVAGTIAGLGDGVHTYSGVAPAAELYAIKVFGATGSTSDEIVIAALEYAADPTGDLTFKEQLDVVNLSLGGGFGGPHMMYNHAIRNLVRGGTMVVASAGNSGDKSYITGAPGSMDDTISVASSIDNMIQNIQFSAVEFTSGGEVIAAEAVEGANSKKLETIPELKGEVIFLGLGDTDFDEASKAQIQGKVAFMDRGKVSFSEKISRAQKAGAIGVIVANNNDEDPSTMGGDGKFEIPSVMITKKSGDQIKEKLKAGLVNVDMKSKTKIEKPWLADTMSGFSSRGPRSDDGLIKPEISSPGSNIISAGRGTGDQGVYMSGTSMAGPHIAGVMALLKQKFKEQNPYELKSVLLGQAKVLGDKEKKQYSVSRQGAGRVQVDSSLNAKIVTVPATLSFGLTDVEKQKTLSQEVLVKNISAEAVTLKPNWLGSSALQVSAGSLTLAPGESRKWIISAKIISSRMKSQNEELDGYLQLLTEKDKSTEILSQLPALAVVRQISQIVGKSVKVHATSVLDGAGSVAEVELQNSGVNKGTAHLFNLLATDGRKKDRTPDLAHNRNCDMQSAGYRLIAKDGGQVLQVAVKLFERMTTWNGCEVNVQIDADGDGVADQEIAGVPMESLPGLTGDKFVSLLLNGKAAREMRKKYEVDIAQEASAPPKEPQPGEVVKPVTQDYKTAVLDLRGMEIFDGATLAIVEADVSLLSLAPTGELNIKVSTTHQDSGVIEYDDYLSSDETKWQKISTNPMAQSFVQLPETVELKASETATLRLQKGYGMGDLIMYAPQNRSVQDVLLEDSQSQVVPVTYGE